MTAQMRTPRLLMRRWQDEDRDPFAAMNADPEVLRYFPEPLSRDESDALIEQIEAHFERYGYGLWALEANGAFIGFTGLSWATWQSDITPALEVGWRLARHAWGQGYATEAAAAALRRGLEEVERIVSFTAVLNEPSQRVMQRLGMRFVCEFDHPRVAEGSALRRHVLYDAERSTWRLPESIVRA